MTTTNPAADASQKTADKDATVSPASRAAFAKRLAKKTDNMKKAWGVPVKRSTTKKGGKTIVTITIG